MNDFITLFHPAQRGGETLFLELQAGSGAKALVHAASPIRTSLELGGTRFSTRQDYRDALEKVSAALKSKGGLLAGWDGERFQLKTFSASGAYSAPERALVLRPGNSTPTWIDMRPRESIARQPGDRLLLPLDSKAESRLEALLFQLEGFSDDIRSGLWAVLRRPSLEARVDRLEQHPSVSSAEALPNESAKASSKVTQARSRASESSVRLWAAAVAVLLLVGTYFANWSTPGFSFIPFVSKKAASGESKTNIVTPQKPSVDTPNEGPTKVDTAPEKDGKPSDEEEAAPPPPDPQQLLQDSFAGLMQALSQAPEGSSLRRLFAAHLQASAESPFEEQVKNASVGWGMAKVHAAMARIPLEDATFLRLQNRSDLKRKLEATPLAEDLLPSFAYFCCQAFEEPGLPEVPGDVRAGAFRPEGAPECTDIDPIQVAETLKLIAQFVKSSDRVEER